MYLSRVEIDTDNRQKIKDLSHLGAYHNWVERSFPAEIAKAYAALFSRLSAGQLLQFKLTANPVRRGGKSSSHPGRLIPCFAVDEQMKWLQGKAEKNGFELVAAEVVGHDRPLLRKKTHVALNRTVFEGRLKISYLDQFKAMQPAGCRVPRRSPVATC